MKLAEFYKLKPLERRSYWLKPELFKEGLKQLLKPKRYEHSLSVAKVAKSLALAHHVDPRKAYLAGLLHDITKYLSEEEAYNYLKYYDEDKLSDPKAIWHSYTAYYYLKEHLHLYDEEVLNAIYHHSDGLSHSKLAMIIYIADKREPLRQIDDNILNLAYSDLYKAFEVLKCDVKEYVLKHGNK